MTQCARTFSPPPHGDAVLVVEANREKQLPIAAEVHTGHAHSVSSLQDGEGLLGVVVPHMNGSCLAELAWKE